jgi:hypothetical protein
VNQIAAIVFELAVCKMPASFLNCLTSHSLPWLPAVNNTDCQSWEFPADLQETGLPTRAVRNLTPFGCCGVWILIQIFIEIFVRSGLLTAIVFSCVCNGVHCIQSKDKFLNNGNKEV